MSSLFHSLIVNFKKIQKTLRGTLNSISVLSRCNLIFNDPETFDDSALPQLHHYELSVSFWSIFVFLNSTSVGFENSYFIMFQNLQGQVCYSDTHAHFTTALLKYNSHTTQLTHLNCKIQRFLISSQSCATINTIRFRTFSSPWKEIPYPLAVVTHSPPTPQYSQS